MCSQESAESENRPAEREPSYGSSSEESEAVEPTKCPNCRRRFTGPYCPECGSIAERSPTVLEVGAQFFWQLVGVERRVGPTAVGLTLRPGETLSRYLEGNRQEVSTPASYLLTMAAGNFLADWTLMQAGMKLSVSSQSRFRLSSIPQEITQLIVDVLQPLGTQESAVAANLVMAVLVSLTIWHLFRRELEGGGVALALGSFVVGNAVFLETVAHLIYIPSYFLVTGHPAEFPILLSVGINVMYCVVAISLCFGLNLSNVTRAVAAFMWASVDLVGLAGIGASGYMIWLVNTYPDIYLPPVASVGSFIQVVLIAGFLFSVPFLLHAGFEVFTRLRQ